MTQSDSIERGARVRFPPPLVFGICVLLGIGVHYFVLRAPVPITRMVSVIGGSVIILLGLCIVISASVLFSKTGQNPIPWTPTPELILRGPYRFTRNPMYVGVTIVQIGLGIAVNNLWISALAPPALLVVHRIAVIPEEEYLTEKFGQSYVEYKARVRRYL